MNLSVIKPYQAACPDCPAARLGTLEEIVGKTKATCGFSTSVLEARSFAPPDWYGRYGFGLVRRGVLIRQRVDAQGRSTAVDAAGPGCLFSLALDSTTESSASSHYAATDVMVCLCSSAVVDDMLGAASPASAELLQLFTSALERVERITQARGRAGATERVASLICTLADTLSPPRRRERLPFGLQQRDLARLLGVRHETFCRTLAKLEKLELVARHPDGLRILDREKLELI